jgi:vacuolar protein sorting-associated protein 18
MAFDTSTGYAAPGTANGLDLEAAVPIFNIQHVALQFAISSDFVAAVVSNNVLILALSTGRILRIDLDSPADIDGIVKPPLA